MIMMKLSDRFYRILSAAIVLLIGALASIYSWANEKTNTTDVKTPEFPVSENINLDYGVIYDFPKELQFNDVVAMYGVMPEGGDWGEERDEISKETKESNENVFKRKSSSENKKKDENDK